MSESPVNGVQNNRLDHLEASYEKIEAWMAKIDEKIDAWPERCETKRTDIHKRVDKIDWWLIGILGGMLVSMIMLFLRTA